MDVYASAISMGNPKSLYAVEDKIDLDIFINEIVEKLKYFFKLDMQESFEKTVRREFSKIQSRRDLGDAQKLAHIKNIVYMQLYPQISKSIRMEMNEQGILQGDKSSAAQKELQEVVEAIIYYNAQEREAKKNIEIQKEYGEIDPEIRLGMYSAEKQK